VDVAAFRVELPDAGFPEILVEDYGPEWVADHLVMESAYVLGYPRIPSAKHAILVGLRCEVSAIVPERCIGNDHMHFVLSSMARGGFSGAPVLGAYGHLIGLVTESFLVDSLPVEFGYMAVVPVAMMRSFLVDAEMLPARDAWRGFGDIG
jgi:hypothetical protein